jgi:hypothetical protein
MARISYNSQQIPQLTAARKWHRRTILPGPSHSPSGTHTQGDLVNVFPAVELRINAMTRLATAAEAIEIGQMQIPQGYRSTPSHTA